MNEKPRNAMTPNELVSFDLDQIVMNEEPEKPVEMPMVVSRELDGIAISRITHTAAPFPRTEAEKMADALRGMGARAGPQKVKEKPPEEPAELPESERLIVEAPGEVSSATGKPKLGPKEKRALMKMHRRGHLDPRGHDEAAVCMILVAYGYAKRTVASTYSLTPNGRAAVKQFNATARFGGMV